VPAIKKEEEKEPVICNVSCTGRSMLMLYCRHDTSKAWLWSWRPRLSFRCITWANGEWHSKSLVHWSGTVQWQSLRDKYYVSYRSRRTGK